MQCSLCGAENEEGRAICSGCGRPLTAYADQITGVVSEATRAKAERLKSRPPVIAAMTTLDILIALFGPFALVYGEFTSRTRISQDSLNYIFAAIGSVGVFLAAIVFIPLGLYLLFLAYSTWTQKPWTWTANLVVLGVVGFTSLIGFWPKGAFLRLVLLALCAAAAFFWYREDTKEWYAIR